MYTLPVLSGPTNSKCAITLWFCTQHPSKLCSHEPLCLYQVLQFTSPTMNCVAMNSKMFFIKGMQESQVMRKPEIQLCVFVLAVMLLCMIVFADGVPLYLCIFACVSPAAGVSTAVGFPAAAPAGPAGPAAASSQPPEARPAHNPARTDGPAPALPHSGSVSNITALYPTCSLQHLVKCPIHQSSTAQWEQ